MAVLRRIFSDKNKSRLIVVAVALGVLGFWHFAWDLPWRFLAAMLVAVCIAQLWYYGSQKLALHLFHGKRGTILTYRVCVGVLTVGAWAMMLMESIEVPRKPWELTVLLVAWGSLAQTCWPKQLMGWAVRPEKSVPGVSHGSQGHEVG